MSAIPRSIYSTGPMRFPLELRGAPVRVVPRAILRGLALAWRRPSWLREASFPSSARGYKSMTENYPTPMTKTFERLGQPSITLQQGVRETGRVVEGNGSVLELIDDQDRSGRTMTACRCGSSKTASY